MSQLCQHGGEGRGPSGPGSSQGIIWEKAKPKLAIGMGTQDGAWPALPPAGATPPSMTHLAPLGVSEIWSLQQGAKAASVREAAAVRRTLFFPCSVISPQCTVPSSESTEE